MNSTNERLVIDETTPEERNQAFRDALAGMNQDNNNRLTAADAARPALERLCEGMAHKTGQSYTLRALLYSLYNGQPASVLEVVTLDWKLKSDLCAVLLGFGYENPRAKDAAFYYDALKASVEKRGLWDWFCEAHESEVSK